MIFGRSINRERWTRFICKNLEKHHNHKLAIINKSKANDIGKMWKFNLKSNVLSDSKFRNIYHDALKPKVACISSIYSGLKTKLAIKRFEEKTKNNRWKNGIFEEWKKSIVNQ